MTSPIRCASEHAGQIERIVLGRPEANTLDCEMLAGDPRQDRRAVAGSGPRQASRLRGIRSEFQPRSSGAGTTSGADCGHALAIPPPVLGPRKALRPDGRARPGRVPGPRFQLAVWCGYLFCEPSARLGFPETNQGVFPTIAALALPWRVTGARSTRLILSGELLSGKEAARCGVADACVEEAEAGLAGSLPKEPGGQVRRRAARGLPRLATPSDRRAQERHLAAREASLERVDGAPRSRRRDLCSSEETNRSGCTT